MRLRPPPLGIPADFSSPPPLNFPQGLVTHEIQCYFFFASPFYDPGRQALPLVRPNFSLAFLFGTIPLPFPARFRAVFMFFRGSFSLPSRQPFRDSPTSEFGFPLEYPLALIPQILAEIKALKCYLFFPDPLVTPFCHRVSSSIFIFFSLSFSSPSPCEGHRWSPLLNGLPPFPPPWHRPADARSALPPLIKSGFLIDAASWLAPKKLGLSCVLFFPRLLVSPSPATFPLCSQAGPASSAGNPVSFSHHGRQQRQLAAASCFFFRRRCSTFQDPFFPLSLSSRQRFRLGGGVLFFFISRPLLTVLLPPVPSPFPSF